MVIFKRSTVSLQDFKRKKHSFFTIIQSHFLPMAVPFKEDTIIKDKNTWFLIFIHWNFSPNESQKQYYQRIGLEKIKTLLHSCQKSVLRTNPQ